MLRRLINTRNTRTLLTTQRRQSVASMAHPLDSVPPHSDNGIETSAPHLSTLENGVRVISLGRSAPLASVGLFIEGGSRFETHARQGAAFYLAQIYTRGTATRSGLRVSRELETLSPNASSSVDRDTIAFTGSVPREHAGELTGMFADMLQPALKPWEVNDAREYVGLKAAAANTAEQQTMALLHAEAFRNVSYGRPLITQNASNVSVEALREHVDECYVGNRVVLVAAGLEHDEAMKVAQTATNGIASGEEAPDASSYVGGNARRDAPGDVTHFAIAHSTEGVDAAAVQVLRVLLGSADAGNKRQFGTGRRLSKANDAFVSAEGFSTASGLFGVRAVVDNAVAVDGVNKAEAVLGSLRDISEEDVNGAKQAVLRELASNFACTTRAVSFLASRAFAAGDVASEESLSQQVSSLTAADVTKAAKKILDTPKTFAAIGDVAGL